MSIHLSLRLKSITHHIPHGHRLADIGTDHAYLPIFLLLSNHISHAIGVDINAGPIGFAAKNVEQFIPSSELISLRQGNGLFPIREGEVDTVVIAGMGGERIQNIMSDGLERLQSVSRVILQANTDWCSLRKFCWANGFCIEEEEMILERGQIFLNLVLGHGDQCGDSLDALGGILLRHRPCSVLDAWLNKRKKTLERIQNSNPNRRIVEVNEELLLLKELISQRS